jgi:outer membrane protein OmpA-like peptidoglycan-associated protein
VRLYLTKHGVAKDRLVAKGYGMSRPIVPNSSESNRALNRRVQFIRVESKD